MGRLSLRLVRGRQQGNTSHMNLLLALAGLGDVVRRLHPHQRVHLHAEGFLDAQRHVPREVGLAVEQAGQGRARNAQALIAAAVTVRPAGSMISVRMKSPGWGGFFMGMVFLLLA